MLQTKELICNCTYAEAEAQLHGSNYRIRPDVPILSCESSAVPFNGTFHTSKGFQDQAQISYSNHTVRKLNCSDGHLKLLPSFRITPNKKLYFNIQISKKIACVYILSILRLNKIYSE